MKYLPFFLLIVLLCLIGCSKSGQTDSCDLENDTLEITHKPFPDGFEIFDKGDNICFVKYSNKINGFDVRIAVRPFAYIDSILFGSAEIAFLRNDTCFISLPNSFFRIDSLNRKQIENFDVVELDYQYPQINKSKPIKFSQFSALPFFFLDVNFDGEDELIMNYAKIGRAHV